ncbi:glycosyltransferase family 4 protein [Zooshikella ganghwensis]|uniref:glycosyltransferase family 4 protein n=1 Tax=Zooshikella ganghwensis TaxID=202772 RepID=UPI00040067FF|nr:glycosyltransferase family 4 protein [Zooshikella ganghwensis]
MKLAFILFKYFPYGGLQRDFLRIALECQSRGHDIVVYTMDWQGEKPAGFVIHQIKPKALAAHKRDKCFHQAVMNHIEQNAVDCVIGFNKMPGLDIYYAADACYEDKARLQRSKLYRLMHRYKHFSAFERGVFSPESATHILLIAPAQQALFEQYYHTPPERFHILPPGISRDRCAPENAAEIRQQLREEFNIAASDKFVLMVGSGFRTKGLDRALNAIAALPEQLKQSIHFMVIGQDNAKPFWRLARGLGIEKQLSILSGRDDIPRFLLGADLLIHPAYHENTGTVLLEAAVAGLPVLTTDICGYAHYIDEADIGRVVQSPFKQDDLNKQLLAMLSDPEAYQQRHENGLQFAKHADIYSMPQQASTLIEQLASQRGK